MRQQTRESQREARLRTGAAEDRDAFVLQKVEPQEIAKRETHAKGIETRASVPTVALPRSDARQEQRKKIGAALFSAFYGDEGTNRQYADFFDEMARRIAMGQTLEVALRQSAPHLPANMQRLIERTAEEMVQGIPLAIALKEWEHYLPEIVLPVLEVAEREGKLERSLHQLAFAFRHLIEVEHSFDYSVANPGLAAPVGILGMMALTSPIAFFALSTPQLMLYCVGGVAIAVTAWVNRRQILVPKRRGIQADTKRLTSRLNGTMERNLATARWSRSFATLWQCGVPVSQALEIAARSSHNAHYERALLVAATRTREGKTLHSSLAETKLLPEGLLDMIETGETTGDIGPALEWFAGQRERDAQTAAAKAFAVKFFGPLLIGAALFALMAGALVWWASGQPLPNFD